MQQRSADRPDGPVGEATVKISVGTGSPAATSPDATAIIPSPDSTALITAVDPDATSRLEVGDRTVRIPLSADDGSATRVLPAPVITTPSASATITNGLVPVPAEARADHRPEFAVLGIATSLIGLAGVLVPDGALSLVLLIVLVALGPGAAILSVANVRNRLISWALAVIASLTVTCAAAVITLWTHIWNPSATFGVLAGATLIGSAVQLVRLSRSGVQLILGRVGKPYDTVDNGVLMAIIPFITLVAGIALWVLALVQLDPDNVSAYGFTASLGIPFVLGVVLILIGFSVELFGRARPWVMSTVLVTIPVIMHATVPLLDGTIEYAWTYKHVGVVDLLRDNGHLLSSSDIYQQWPGFFALVAMMSHVSAVDALSFAAWSSLTFALLNSLMAAALLRQFTQNRRIIALGVLLVQICMWVDIGYFSPQAFVYTLMLGFWVIVTRWLMHAPELGEPTGRIRRLQAWLVRGMPAGLETDRRTRIWASLAATAVFAAITVSHQLTPFVMLVPIVALSILGVIRPRLLSVGLIVLVIAFVAPRLGSVSSQYSLFSFDLLSNASGNTASWNTPEQEFSATVARTLALGVWFAAVIGIFLSRRKVGRVLVPALLAFLPMCTLVAGNYGGEAIYRVFAFSLPFVALLIGAIWIGRKGRRGVPAMLVSGVLLAAMLLAGLQGLHGQLMVHQVRATDIEAAEYFYANAERNSALVLVAPNFPTKLTGNYGSFNRGHVSVDISLVGDPLFTGNLSGSRLPEVETYIKAMNYSTNYLVVSEAMADYTDYFGTEPEGTMASLDTALRASANWTVFYQGPGVTIYQLKK